MELDVKKNRRFVSEVKIPKYTPGSKYVERELNKLDKIFLYKRKQNTETIESTLNLSKRFWGMESPRKNNSAYYRSVENANTDFGLIALPAVQRPKKKDKILDLSQLGVGLFNWSPEKVKL